MGNWDGIGDKNRRCGDKSECTNSGMCPTGCASELISFETNNHPALITMLLGSVKSAAGFIRRSRNIAARASCISGSCQSIKIISNSFSYRCFSDSPLTGDTSGSAARDLGESSLHISDSPSVLNGVEEDTASINGTLHIDNTSAVDGIAQLSSDDLGFSPIHIAIQLVESIHMAAGIPYWEAIALSTLGVRLVLLPTALIVARDVSKMRALKPELKKIRESMNNKISPDDPTKKFKYIEQVNKLFASHDVEPLKTVCLAAFQFPIFISFFFGMRQMGNYFPGFSAGGGDYWFADLSAADPTYILPCVNAVSFLLMVEVSAGNGQANPLKWVREQICRAFLNCCAKFMYFDMLMHIANTFVLSHSGANTILHIHYLLSNVCILLGLYQKKNILLGCQVNLNSRSTISLTFLNK